MTYSRKSLLYVTQEEFDSSAHIASELLVAYFDHTGPNYANWLNVPYLPAPREYGKFIIHWCNEWKIRISGKTYKLNPIAVACQIIHESASGQSQFFRERRNPSGLGAINSAPGNAVEFQTHSGGVRATIAHLMTYISGPGPWTEFDPRAEAVPERNQGVARRLEDLEQRWAWTDQDEYEATPPDQRYGGSIASLMNDYIVFADSYSTDAPKQRVRVPRPDFIDCFIGTDHRGRPNLSMDYEWVTIHNTSNPDATANAAAHCTYLQGGAEGRTVGWHVTVDDIEIYQHLPFNEVGWQAGDGFNGAGNRRSVGIEGCMYQGQNFDAMMDNLAWAAAYLLDQKDLGIEKMVQHNHWSGKNCPKWIIETNMWGELIKRTQHWLHGATGGEIVVDDPNARFFDETKFWVINLNEARMLDLWKEFDGLREPDPIGYPLTGMITDENGVYRQLFENRMLEIWPDGTQRSGAIGRRYIDLLNRHSSEIGIWQ